MILNLGCGSKTASSPDVVNIDWSIYLRARTNPLLRLIAPLIFRGDRRTRYENQPGNILVHNLAKGIPFPNQSADAIYHSHLLEHLDREVARSFLVENFRVLKGGGIIRIVVPDFEMAVREYLANLDASEHQEECRASHGIFLEGLLEQSVRREAAGTQQQPRLRRFIENALLGDARARGETHQWAYDHVYLSSLLLDIGFQGIQRRSFDTSGIPGWAHLGLDRDSQGDVYKPKSLYLEASRPR